MIWNSHPSSPQPYPSLPSIHAVVFLMIFQPIYIFNLTSNDHSVEWYVNFGRGATAAPWDFVRIL
jgi:hypothetical protein